VDPRPETSRPLAARSLPSARSTAPDIARSGHCGSASHGDWLTEAWYPTLYRRKPLGLALDEHYRGVGELYSKLKNALDDVALMKDGARDRATYYRLTATDRQSLVILGDPTVMVPPLPSQGV
jgi:hypothetical protein